MIDLDKLVALLSWAEGNLGQLNEIAATEEGVYFRLTDGRAGLLMMRPDGVPMASIPGKIMTA